MRLLLHGFTGSPASWDGLFEDEPRWAPALPGHGAPAVPFQEATRQLAEALSGPATVIGYSLGARVALGVALRAPEKVAQLILIGVNPGLESEAARQQRRAADQEWIDLLEQEGLDAFLARWRALPLFATQLDADPMRRSAQANIGRSHHPRDLADALRFLGLAEMPNFWPRLGELTMRCTLVTGAKDQKFCDIAERAAALMPNCRRIVLAGVGHNPLLEAPDRLQAELRSP